MCRLGASSDGRSNRSRSCHTFVFVRLSLQFSWGQDLQAIQVALSRLTPNDAVQPLRGIPARKRVLSLWVDAVVKPSKDPHESFQDCQLAALQDSQFVAHIHTALLLVESDQKKDCDTSGCSCESSCDISHVESQPAGVGSACA